MSIRENNMPLTKGVVMKKTRGCTMVHVENEKIACEIASGLFKRLVYPTADPSSRRHKVMEVQDIQLVDPVAVGDRVHFINHGDGTGLITEILPRRSKLARRAAGKKPLEQVIVANVDQIIPVFAVRNPTPKWNLLDRYLVAAESLDLPALICLTKLDLGLTDELASITAAYVRIGYPIVATSAQTGEGLETFKQALHGRTSVFIGKSGVGKTSLLNALQPGLGRQVKQVNLKTGKGKHTTTHLEMFPLEMGGNVIDTPGMREFGLWDVDEVNLAHFFPEMRPFLGKCKFGLNCHHNGEPGCAIQAAVERGEIDARRYHSYLRLQQ